MFIVQCFVFSILLSSSLAQLSLQVGPDSGFPVPVDSLDSPILKGKNSGCDQSCRLPLDVIPYNYDFELVPIISKGFEGIEGLGNQWDCPGKIKASVKCVQATSRITMHAVDTVIHSVHVTQEGQSANLTGSWTLDAAKSFLHINVTTPLQVNQNYTVDIDFTSYIAGDKLSGLYQSRYVDPATGETKELATSQMEAINARQMIPCFDEPMLKATFNAKIARHNSNVVLFNTQITRTDPATEPGWTNWVWETFAPTVKMSTYLLALIVSEFEYVDKTSNNLTDKQVRTYAPKHFIDPAGMNGGIYAANKADELLAFFQDQYAETYPLTKMDSAAVPDFFFGAMENWGLNIYRETALLYFPDESTEAERHSITSILAHELVHQWFGNLVTTGWWTHIWLNEGFATFCAAQGAFRVAPEFESWERYQNDAIQRSMLFDVQPSYTHPVKIDETEWYTREPMGWFGRIIYEKAGSLIYMMEGVLGKDTLRDALRQYLNTKQYDGAFQDELFHHWNNFATGKLPVNLTVKDVMDTWTLQAGHPLVRVTQAGANRIFVSQERFANNAGTGRNTVSQLDPTDLWHIPISITTNSGRNFDPAPEQWLRKNVALTSFQYDTKEWIMLNAGAQGYFRVMYDVQMLNKIKAQFEEDHSVIGSTTRSQFLDDYFNLAFQRYVSIETALGLTTYLGKESAIVVWNSVLTNLRQPFNLISGHHSGYASFRAYMLPKIKDAITLTGGIAYDPALRGMHTIRHMQFMDWACTLEDSSCLIYAKALFSAWQAGGVAAPVPVDIQPTVYCAALAHADDQDAAFDFIFAQYNSPTTSVKQRGVLLNSMGCVRQIHLIESVLEKVRETSFQSTAHGQTAMQRLAMHAPARQRLYRFFQSSFAEIVTKYGINSIVQVVSTMSNYVSTTVELDLIKAFLDENKGELGTLIDEHISRIESNIRWMNDFGNSMKTWFDAQTP